MALLKIGLLLCLAACSVLGQRPRVNIPGMGMVEGTKSMSTLENKEFYNFRGIQFGRPPSGDLRFKAPEWALPWKGVKNARRWGRLCPQTGAFKSLSEEAPPNFWQRFHTFMTGSNMTSSDPREDEDVEDCLYTHVYTNSLDPDAKLPVMVFFHGGSFQDGDARPYYPTHFMDHDMVLVVPHYRLGPIGFISMQNSKVPGNAGMLDQVLALEWVQKYIHLFGGDPEHVTAFGESAGGASVSLLAVSPLTKGLFKGVIAESGAALAEWAIDREPAYNARGIAKYTFVCDLPTDDEISDCLMTVDVLTLLRAYRSYWRDEQRLLGKHGFGGCSPVVQAPGTGRIFLDRDPALYWDDPEFRPVPAIMGANKHEGTYVLTIVYDDYLRPLGLLNDTDYLTYDMMKPFFGMFGVTDTGHVVSDALEFEYVGYDRLGNFTAMAPGLIDFSGATFLKAPGYQSVIKHARTTDSYWYAFNFFGPLTLAVGNGVVGTEYPFPPGVCHAAEVIYLFGIPGLYAAMSEDETLICRQMVKMWYNFAKYGNPVAPENPIEGDVEWPPYKPDTEYYLSIARNMSVRQDYTKEYTIAKEQNFGLNGTFT